MNDSGELPYKIGTEKLISVTERASRELQSLFQKKGGEDAALRVAVIGGGCAGLSYKMDLVDGPRPKDILVESLGVKIVIDPKSALYVSGSKLDFSDDLQNGGFQVTNPNAASSCSCGKSFST
jgi:iron-sulfur cluster assembly accessory protein